MSWNFKAKEKIQDFTGGVHGNPGLQVIIIIIIVIIINEVLFIVTLSC